MAYAYYLDQEGPALNYFERALEARPEDEDTLAFIEGLPPPVGAAPL